MKEDKKRLIGKYSKMSRGAYIAATLLDSKKKEEPSGHTGRRDGMLLVPPKERFHFSIICAEECGLSGTA